MAKIKLIRCPKCRSIEIKITLPSEGYLLYHQNQDGLEPMGGEFEENKKMAVCVCMNCGNTFKIRSNRVCDIPVLD